MTETELKAALLSAYRTYNGKDEQSVRQALFSMFRSMSAGLFDDMPDGEVVGGATTDAERTRLQQKLRYDQFSLTREVAEAFIDEVTEGAFINLVRKVAGLDSTVVTCTMLVNVGNISISTENVDGIATPAAWVQQNYAAKSVVTHTVNNKLQTWYAVRATSTVPGSAPTPAQEEAGKSADWVSHEVKSIPRTVRFKLTGTPALNDQIRLTIGNQTYTYTYAATDSSVNDLAAGVTALAVANPNFTVTNSTDALKGLNAGFAAGVWQTALTAVGILAWSNTQAYPVNSVVLHNGQLWTNSQQTIAGEEPGVSNKWALTSYGAAGGDLTGSYPNPTLVAVTTAATKGSASKVPVITVDAKGRVTTLTEADITGGAPSGPAGGDLTGTYPNPTLAAIGQVATKGTADKTPTITIDTKGRVTTLTEQSISITPSQAGLGNVDNVQQIPMSYLSTDGTLSDNSDVKVATQKATKTYADTKIPKSLATQADQSLYSTAANTWAAFSFTSQWRSFVSTTKAAWDETNGILTSFAFQVNTAPAVAQTTGIGKLIWNDTYGAIETLLKGGNADLLVGQQLFTRVRNAQGVQITKGQAVYLFGATGVHSEVKLANANSETTAARTLGIVVETINNNNEGFVITNGILRNVNTDHLTEGALVWLDTVDGQTTSTRPTAPNHGVFLGMCVRKHQNVGVLYVTVVNGLELKELHDVLINGIDAGHILIWNNTTKVWENKAQSNLSLTSSQVGLGNVTNVAQLPLSYLSTDGTLGDNSDTKVPSQKAVKTYVDTAVTGLLDFKGSTDCSGNPNYPAGSKGDAYIVSVAGKIGGASGVSVDVGDVYLATADNAGGTQAAVGSSWAVLEHNLVGALLAANNLSDLANTATARTNLGLGTAATQNSTAFATAAQGTLADTAVQRAGDTMTGDLTLSNDTSLKMTEGAFYNLTRTMPSTVGYTIEIGNITTTDFAANCELWYNIHYAGFSQSKRYFFPLSYNATAGAWMKLLPISSTGPYASQDADVEISVTNNIAYLRIRRSSLLTYPATGPIDLVLFVNGSSTTFTPTSVTATGVSAPTSIYPVKAEGFLSDFVGTGLTSVPATNRSLIMANTLVTDLGSYSLNSWNSTGFRVPIYSCVTTNNGGGTPAVSQPALVLARQGVNGVAYGNFAELKIRRWEASGVAARTGMDIALTHGNGDAAGTDILTLISSGNVGIGQLTPTAALHLKAGTATASTAPLKFTSGTLLTSAEAGAVEFLSDDLLFTITTGTARKRIALCDAALTSGRIAFSTTNGRLTDSSTLTYTSGSAAMGISLAQNTDTGVTITNTDAGTLAASSIKFVTNSAASGRIGFASNASTYSGGMFLEVTGAAPICFATNGSRRVTITGTDGYLAVNRSSATARLHIAAGTSSATTAPLKFDSGTLMSTPEAGAVEFLTDKAYLTITTGAARKELALADTALTSGQAPSITTNGRLTNSNKYDIYATGTTNGTANSAVSLTLLTLASSEMRYVRITVKAKSANIPPSSYGRNLDAMWANANGTLTQISSDVLGTALASGTLSSATIATSASSTTLRVTCTDVTGCGATVTWEVFGQYY